MPESLIWRTLASLDATSADFVIVLLGFVVLIGVWYLHNSQKRELERLRLEYKQDRDKLWLQVSQLKERYHRLDAMSYAQAKSIQHLSTGKVRLVNESANGDGDYSLDRSTD